MSGETPKIDLEALRVRLQAGVGRSISAADAADKPQSPERVLPTSVDNRRARVSPGTRKDNGNETDVEKLRARWIGITGQSIAEARTLDDLMKLVNVVQSKRGSAKLSFPLPEGLPTLLANDEGFSKEFKRLFDKWSSRVTEVLFDEDGAHRFRDFLRDVVKKSPDIKMGRFFDMYLGRCDSKSLNGVPLVISRMKELWKQHLPVVRQELMEKKNWSGEIIVGETYVLMNDPSQEYTVTEISADGDIAYMPIAGGTTLHSSREKFLKYLQVKGARLNAQSKNLKTIPYKKSSTNFAGQHKGGEPDEDAMRRHLARLEKTGASNPGDQSLIPKTALQSAVEAVKITPKNLEKSSERTYDELFKEADDGPYHGILFGAAAAGFLTMKEGAEKESVDLKAYDKDHPGEILEALIDGMKDSFHRVGKKLGWSESETNIYARGLVQESIEKYLK